ncbi:MAG: glyoxalase superfamily protein [Parvularculaceae bacterium]
MQTRARERIDIELGDRVSAKGILTLRKALAALVGIRRNPSGRKSPIAYFKNITPILFVRDVETAARFYVEKLGFSIDFLYGAPPFYGSVSRDGACLHLRHVKHPNFAALSAKEESLILATIEVADVRAVLADLEARGAPISRALMEQPWGGTDFYIRDSDGNEISFVEFRTQKLQNGDAE